MMEKLYLVRKKQHDKDEFQSMGKDILYNYFTETNENNMKVFN